MKSIGWRRKLLFLSVPAVLALAGGAVAASAYTGSGPSTPTGTQSPSTQAPEPAESADANTTETGSAGDPAEAPGAPQSGHQDTAGGSGDHQFDGQE